MDKNIILQLFLRHGAQIDQKALEFLEKNPIVLEQVLKIEETKLPPVITYDFLKTLSEDVPYYKKLSIDQLSKILTERYEFLKETLVNKQELPNLISINKISERTKQFSVIGVVSEVNDTLTLEDPTGQARFNIQKEQMKNLVEDEVIGTVCERISGENKVKLVVYPDIPLKKENNKTTTPEKYLFISDIHMDSRDFNENYYRNLISWLDEQKEIKIIVLGGISKHKDDVTKLLEDIHHPSKVYSESDITIPSTIQVENIQILLVYNTFLEEYTKRFGTSLDAAIVNLIKKRNLNPKLSPTFYNNSYLLRTIPDIIVISGANTPILTNYKGTTVLTTGSFTTQPIYWLINLQTRETFKIDFS